jgi:chromosome partitioning protein
MAQIVTIINFKGGVGKTTCSVEIACSLAKYYGRRTLLVDLDPQASATFYVMEQDHWKIWQSQRGTTYNLFEQHTSTFPIRNAIVRDVISGTVLVPGFDLLPSTPDLIDVDLRLADFVGYNILQRHLDEISAEYDYILCDCPPNFNPVTKNSIWASDAYVIPTIPDFLSTYGIGLLQRSVHKFFSLTSSPQTPVPTLGGIILTRIKTNTILHATYCEQVHFDYPHQVFNHMISDSVKIAEAAGNRLPISAIASPKEEHLAKLQNQFQALAGEFISRIRHINPSRKSNPLSPL